MEEITGRSRTSQLLLTAASFVIVVAGLKAAASIIVPFLLAVFISIICSAPLFWLKRKGLPTWLSIIIVVGGILLIVYSLGSLIGSSLNEFYRNIPFYSKKINQQYKTLLDLLGERGIDTSRLKLVEVFDPGKVMQLVARLFNGLGDVLTNGFLILVTVIFMLLEASSFPEKMFAVLHQPQKTMDKIKQITNEVKHYLAIKTFISFMTGALVAIFLMIIGVDYPLLWGLFAFLLNYVPNIGSIIASIPAILQAFIQMGLGGAIGVTIGYLLINMVMANLVEPRLMGKRLGLSTLVVFLSLIFWGWVLGPVGMLLSVVLTVTVKIIMESRRDTRWLALLLGSEVPSAEKPDQQVSES